MPPDPVRHPKPRTFDEIADAIVQGALDEGDTEKAEKLRKIFDEWAAENGEKNG